MSRTLDAIDVCSAMAAWATAAGVSRVTEGETRTDSNTGALIVWKSDLLNRLIYGGEKAPSQTPCPVHKGSWSGCHFGWPGDEAVSFKPTGFGAIIGSPPREVSPHLQAWYDEGCRCFRHKGSSCTTGWQPDEFCGCQP